MKIKNKIMFLIICASLNTFAQEPILTKKQMYKDFDQLVKIIEDCNVQLPVRKAVTGFDNLAEIKKLRKGIDTVTCDEGFKQLLKKGLTYVFDIHSSIDYNVYNFDNIVEIDTASIRRQYNEYYSMENIRNIEYNFFIKYFPISPTYYNGEYYFSSSTKYINKSNIEDTILFNDSKVKFINKEHYSDHVIKNISNYYYSDNRFDFKNNKYYSHASLIPNNSVITIEQNGKIKEIDLKEYKMLSVGSFIDNIYDDIKKRESKENNGVSYFNRDSILYIYLNNMYEGEFLVNLKDTCKDKVINKIVIDVRENKGGSDKIWMDLLTLIIADSIPFTKNIVCFDNDLTREKLDFYKEYLSKTNINWITKKTLLTISDNSYLVADSNSLNYKGKIYILQNENVYSAAHSLTSYAKQVDNIISVGTPTGLMAGFGLVAPLFQLQNSKFTFRLTCFIDITNVSQVKDIYQDFPEVQVELSLDEYFRYYNDKEIYDTKSEEYLYKYDSMFKKILELK